MDRVRYSWGPRNPKISLLAGHRPGIAKSDRIVPQKTHRCGSYVATSAPVRCTTQLDCFRVNPAIGPAVPIIAIPRFTKNPRLFIGHPLALSVDLAPRPLRRTDSFVAMGFLRDWPPRSRLVRPRHVFHGGHDQCGASSNAARAGRATDGRPERERGAPICTTLYSAPGRLMNGIIPCPWPITVFGTRPSHFSIHRCSASTWRSLTSSGLI